MPAFQKRTAQRQIPTLLGIGILILSLIGGIAMIGTGGGVFTPRATPQTTPQNIKVTNVNDTGFTVSFLTDEATSGFIKYGEIATELKLQASDDRDQLSGSVGQYSTHHISVKNVDPDKDYYFTLGTASVSKHDNNGAPFTVKTAKRARATTAAKTVYGNIMAASGSPAEGAVVYLTIPEVGELSTLVRSSGSWAIPLSNARKRDSLEPVDVSSTETLNLFVQGPQISSTTTLQVTVDESQPVRTISLGGAAQPDTDTFTTDSSSEDEDPDKAENDVIAENPSSLPSESPSPLPEDSPTPAATEVVTVNLDKVDQPTVNTTQPTIMGKAAPGVVVTIQVNSETQIVTQVTADAAGNFSLPLSLGEKELEPGEHSVTITYTDPATGQQKTETKTFYVSSTATSRLLAQANTSPTPFGTNNPFTIPSPSPLFSPSPTASSSASTSASPRVTMPSTSSALPKSGSVGTTLMLLAGGFLCIATGIWSYWQSRGANEADFANADDPKDIT